MTISKHHNKEYSGGIPEATGDRYFTQDLIRDLHYLLDRTGYILKDLVSQVPLKMSGGAVSQGSGTTLNITLGFGYAKYEVDIVSGFASVPPSMTQEDIECMRIAWDAQTNLAIASAVADGATPNYVKVSYAESGSTTRTREFKAGTYVYAQSPSFEIIVDDVAPTDYEVCLKTFTLTAGGVFAFSDYSGHEFKLKAIQTNDLDVQSGSSVKSGGTSVWGYTNVGTPIFCKRITSEAGSSFSSGGGTYTSIAHGLGNIETNNKVVGVLHTIREVSSNRDRIYVNDTVNQAVEKFDITDTNLRIYIKSDSGIPTIYIKVWLLYLK